MDATPITIVAILAGPILAVQAQKWIERARDVRGRRLHIFRNLMATRGLPLSPAHVEALNVVDVEYHGVQKVVDAWRLYQDHLNHFPQPDAAGKVDKDAVSRWHDQRPNLLTDLLFEMATHLKLNLDKVALKRTAYAPQAYLDIEQETASIRRNLAGMLSLKALPVVIMGQVPAAQPVSPPGPAAPTQPTEAP